MDAVEILLMGIVGLSILVFFIFDNLDRGRKQSAGGGGDADKQVAAEYEVLEREEFQESEEIEETDEFVDDWEGVERSELEKIFGEAIVFVNSMKTNDRRGGGDGIGEDVKMELYGLQKVALEGPCFQSQPMSFNLSARSKWKAWQKLGNLSEETAMEKYINILSDAIPNWNVNENLQSRDENIQGVEGER